MNPFTMALAIAAVAAGIAGVLSLVRYYPSGSWGKHAGQSTLSFGAAVATTIVTFFVMWFIDWWILYSGRPVMLHATLWGWVIVEIIIMIVLVAIIDLITGALSPAPCVLAVSLVIYLIFGTIVINSDVTSNSDAKRIVHLLNVTKEPPAAIPDTDTNHMKIVSTQTAAFRARQALSDPTATAVGANTYFTLATPQLQLVSSHLYYVVGLTFNGSSSQNAKHGIVPGYFLVDAEDPDADVKPMFDPPNATQPKYSMKYSAGAAQEHSIERHVYETLPDYYIDDLTLEIDDNFRPYFTAALNRPQAKWGYSAPVGAITVDAYTGQIKQYSIDPKAPTARRLPAWVDRVYSSGTASTMMNWWGNWAHAPYSSNPQPGGRYKVSGEPTLTYTTDGQAAWRMLLTGQKNTSSVDYIVLFDTRSATVHLYEPERAMGTEESVLHTFATAKDVTNTKYVPVDLALHMIYGQLTWVVSYVAPSDDPSNPEPFQGIGLLNAYDTSGAGVVFATNKATALQNYEAKLASGDKNTSPGAGGTKSTITGTVKDYQLSVAGGDSVANLILAQDPTHSYVGPVSVSPELVFVKPGDHVTITYRDTGSARRAVQSLDDASLQLANR